VVLTQISVAAGNQMGKTVVERRLRGIVRRHPDVGKDRKGFLIDATSGGYGGEGQCADLRGQKDDERPSQFLEELSARKNVARVLLPRHLRIPHRDSVFAHASTPMR